ncbi:LysR family transcriptional regulator substrate-binding protein [Paenibacillus lautus]|uniref:LysR substrate-binding domain-containing protein n=1 Tax=Paenibacillus lautus TaxID=1401 RepID=A0A1R1B5Z6_PAELA|nr:LysR family transcriptional regulator substrate-binding protein [Paenibacillus lautus]OME94991.1 hypothetical protein BK123_07825 [Paenibacillus lautus]
MPQGHSLADHTPINLDELKDKTFIDFKEDFIFQQMNEKFLKEAGIAPRYVCRVDEPPAIASLVRAGLGFALFECLKGTSCSCTNAGSAFFTKKVDEIKKTVDYL